MGASFREIRHRLRLTQDELAARAGVSRSAVSRTERGLIEEVGLHDTRRIARVLEVRLDLTPRWRGGDLGRLLGRRHAALHETVIAIFEALPGWEAWPEISFSVYGERGVIDLLAWHAPTRTLLVIELKTEFVDVQALVGTVDRYRRLAPGIARERGCVPQHVGVWVAVADTRTNRRHLAEHRGLLRAAFPSDGRVVRAWLRRPTGAIAALSFVPYAPDRNVSRALTSPKRVRRGDRARLVRHDPAVRPPQRPDGREAAG